MQPIRSPWESVLKFVISQAPALQRQQSRGPEVSKISFGLSLDQLVAVNQNQVSTQNQEKMVFEFASHSKSKMGPGELIIRLKQAKHVSGHDFMCLGRADMYMLFSLGGEKRKSKVIHNAGANPKWNEKISFKIAHHVKFELYETLHLILCEDDMGRDDVRGTAKIDIEKLLVENVNEVPFRSYPVYQDGRQRGTVELALSFIPNFNKRSLRHCLANDDL
ncbi:hypothetical protein R1sor_016034 [Riccia sorocarpa]|uniref:C2 domain-containing protein n=1 Tax=Riccia sorocarpa TaxID=122646 RepID=A0ABD3HHB5_9MARC